MAIQAGLLGFIEGGVGAVTAEVYAASRNQAVLFSSVNGVVSCILRCLIDSYIQDSRQLIISTIVIQATSGLAGVLMTRLFCEKTIDWKPALASFVISDMATHHVCSLLMKPMLLKPILEMT